MARRVLGSPAAFRASDRLVSSLAWARSSSLLSVQALRSASSPASSLPLWFRSSAATCAALMALPLWSRMCNLRAAAELVDSSSGLEGRSLMALIGNRLSGLRLIDLPGSGLLRSCLPAAGLVVSGLSLAAVLVLSGLATSTVTIGAGLVIATVGAASALDGVDAAGWAAGLLAGLAGTLVLTELVLSGLATSTVTGGTGLVIATVGAASALDGVAAAGWAAGLLTGLAGALELTELVLSGLATSTATAGTGLVIATVGAASALAGVGLGVVTAGVASALDGGGALCAAGGLAGLTLGAGKPASNKPSPGRIGEKRTSETLPVWMLMKRSLMRRMMGCTVLWATDAAALSRLMSVLVDTLFSLENAPSTAL
ncbi:hypothetical protein RC55_15255 [Herbaspirillum seropedicae]|nr:hypothetical protein ACP92_14420 [Herbaspirillum seropedicae]NQE30586.1 hypothetical protein [Herbaspirillum seropedicae]